MRVTQHHTLLQPMARRAAAGGALLMAMMLSGCSAANMTDFDFPVFGLTKKSGAESDTVTTSSLPPGVDRYGLQSEKLTSQ